MKRPDGSIQSLQCDMYGDCTEEVTHLDANGFVYCTPHGIARRDSKPCRKLRPHELNRLRRGEQLRSYR